MMELKCAAGMSRLDACTRKRSFYITSRAFLKPMDVSLIWDETQANDDDKEKRKTLMESLEGASVCLYCNGNDRSSLCTALHFGTALTVKTSPSHVAPSAPLLGACAVL